MDYKTALNKAMAICSKKEYCKSEIVQKLQAWNLEEKYFETLIHQLSEDNFFNEERYAEAFVKDKFRFNKWGKIKIKSHLKLKQIDPEIIDKSLNIIDKEDYLNLIESLAISKKKSIKAKNEFEQKQKLLRFLAQRGFELDLSSEVINRLSTEE